MYIHFMLILNTERQNDTKRSMPAYDSYSLEDILGKFAPSINKDILLA